ncbi:MAG: hypothetical protein R3B48_26810 [Kofleriaceae bacterium]
MSRDLVRWLLRTLVEPAFLRYYVLEPELPLSLPAFEAEFFALESDQERPSGARQAAWLRLQRWTPLEAAHGVPPARWFQSILRGLRDEEGLRASLPELAQFWALRELFEEPSESGQVGTSQASPPPSQAGDDNPRYHELHCHFRGGVPFFVLWHGFLIDARQRATLRREPLLNRGRRICWAELLDRVARETLLARETLHGEEEQVENLDENVAREHVVTRTRSILDVQRPLEDLRRDVQYVATCAGLATYLRHQRTPGGLAPFATSYDRYSRVQRRSGLSGELHTGRLVHKLLQRFEREGAAVVELRPTLERTRAELQRKLRGLARGYLDYLCSPSARPPIAMGLVPSLFKQELGGRQEPASSTFWQRQQDVWVNQVEALLEVLREDPVARWLVVGLDAAGQERGCPPGVLAPAFALVRRYNQGNQYARPGRAMSPGALRTLLEQQNADPLDVLARQSHWMARRIRLGVTIHAGEEFEDPLTGLRHIWETVEHLQLFDGDRVGHALAAGLGGDLLEQMLSRRYGTPPGTRSDAYRVSKPRGTHLLDLAWLSIVAPEPYRRAARAQLGEVATRALGAPVNVEWILQELREHGSMPRLGVLGARFLAGDHVGANELESVVLDQAWRELFEAMRQQVLHLLVRKRIVVESCPTSNLVVANLRTPPLEHLLQTPGLRVVVATDDPGLLGSYPRTELQRVPQEHLARVLQAASDASFVWLPQRDRSVTPGGQISDERDAGP